ncbi:MAG: galactokinase [Acidimicrobiales bacterium]
MSPVVRAVAPGRVNLIGDHTDYNAGLALPLAVQLRTTVELRCGAPGRLTVRSSLGPPATVATGPGAAAPSRVTPAWARLAAAVVAEAGWAGGGVADVVSTVPVGAGLSSSAAFAVALALAVGVRGDPVEVARRCQRAEALAGSGVGLMDPLVALAAREGTCLLLDLADDTAIPVPFPDGAELVVVHSGVERVLADTPYGRRRAECEAAAAAIGRPLGTAGPADLRRLADPVLRRRAGHVVAECRRVRELAAALAGGDLRSAGAVMAESHRSLAEDFECSTDEVDRLVAALASVPGVAGARMTGGGFGGCAVALAEAGALSGGPSGRPAGLLEGRRFWAVVPSGPASVSVEPEPEEAAAGTPERGGPPG